MTSQQHTAARRELHQPDPALPGHNRKGNALLCFFWGETAAPGAAIAHTRGDLIAAIKAHWLGDVPDDDEELLEVLAGISEHNFHNLYEAGELEWELEIGGVRFTDVYAERAGLKEQSCH